jgi:hypothetical protein
VLRRSLAGETLVGASDAFEIARSLPHGHVAAVLGVLRDLDLERLIWTCESNCAYDNALHLSPSPFARELGALRACGGARRRQDLEQHPRCVIPMWSALARPRGRRHSGDIDAANGQKRAG